MTFKRVTESMRAAAIGGIGHTAFGRLPDRTAIDLEAEAARRAIDDAGLRPGDIDGLLTAPGAAQGIIEGITPHFCALGRALGMNPNYTGSELLGGAASIGIVRRAVMAIESGLYSACLCEFGDSALSTPGSFSYGRGEEAIFGLFGAAGLHALAAQRHMHRWGTRAEHFGEVAMAARAHAARVPHAQRPKPLNMDQYLASPFIAEPIRRADCCLVSDGAAAVLVVSKDRTADLRHPPTRILGHGQAHSLSTFSSREHFDTLPAARSGRATFARAGITVDDIDLALLYDCFTIVVLLQLEDYGFCPRGEAGAFVEGGRIGPGGDLPVNTSGGLLAEGYGGGMLHIVEAVRQLRGEAGERQVADAEVALVSGHGLGMNAHTTMILGR